MPEIKLLSVNTFAEASGIDRRTVSKRLENIEPAKTTGKARLYPLADLLKACALDIARVYLPQVTATPEGETLEQAKTRKESALATLHEMEIAERQGRFVDAEAMADVWVRITTNVKQRLLAIPSRAAPLLVGKKQPGEAFRIVNDLIYEALTELSAQNPETVTRPE